MQFYAIQNTKINDYINTHIFVRGQLARVDRRGNLHDHRALSRMWVYPLLVAFFSLGFSEWAINFYSVYRRPHRHVSVDLVRSADGRANRDHT